MKIKAVNLTKQFNKDYSVIKDLNVEFEKDKIYGIVSPNGRGKTTLINLLSGFIKFDNGEILFEGDISYNDITIVYGGDKNLYMKNTVKENIYYFSVLRGISVKDI